MPAVRAATSNISRRRNISFERMLFGYASKIAATAGFKMLAPFLIFFSSPVGGGGLSATPSLASVNQEGWKCPKNFTSAIAFK